MGDFHIPYVNYKLISKYTQPYYKTNYIKISDILHPTFLFAL